MGTHVWVSFSSFLFQNIVDHAVADDITISMMMLVIVLSVLSLILQLKGPRMETTVAKDFVELEELKGRARHLGISNSTIDHICRG